jgi:antitoxin component of MazEF toxin-antitoxin module
MADAETAQSAPPKPIVSATPAISAEEARAAAEDELVARITGDASIVVAGAERRRAERLDADANQRAAAERVRAAADVEALAVSIIAA